MALTPLKPLTPIGQSGSKASFANEPQSISGNDQQQRQQIQRAPLGPPGLQTFRDMQRAGQARPPSPAMQQAPMQPAPPMQLPTLQYSDSAQPKGPRGGQAVPKGPRGFPGTQPVQPSANPTTQPPRPNTAPPSLTPEQQAAYEAELALHRAGGYDGTSNVGAVVSLAYGNQNSNDVFRDNLGGEYFGGYGYQAAQAAADQALAAGIDPRSPEFWNFIRNQLSQTTMIDPGTGQVVPRGQSGGDPVTGGTQPPPGDPNTYNYSPSSAPVGSRGGQVTQYTGGPANTRGTTRLADAIRNTNTNTSQRPNQPRIPGPTGPENNPQNPPATTPPPSTPVTNSPPPYTPPPTPTYPTPQPGSNPQNNGQGFDPMRWMEEHFSGQRQSPESEAARAALMDLLENPSGWDSEMVDSLIARHGGRIDDEFAQREDLLQEEMAARGLSDSSIYGGRSSDLNVARKSAEQDLSEWAIEQAASSYSQDRLSAIAAALGADDQLSDQDMQMLAMLLGFGQQGFENDMTIQEFMRRLQNDQDALALATSAFGDF